MTTAAEYRKRAEECFEWARTTRDERVREQYASLGKVWLECAGRIRRDHSGRNNNRPESGLGERRRAGMGRPESCLRSGLLGLLRELLVRKAVPGAHFHQTPRLINCNLFCASARLKLPSEGAINDRPCRNKTTRPSW
jgi:hypothetical protein